MAVDCLPHVHLYAMHAERGFHSDIPGIGALCRKDDFLIGAGAYANSKKREGEERQITVYAAAGWQPLKFGPMRVGAFGGLASGYRPGLVPIAAGFVSLWQVHVTLIPRVKDITPATAAFSFTVPF